MARYSRSTRFYRIPVMGYGDQMTEEQEMAQMGVIDSLLYAACFGCGKAILEEGEYAVEFTPDRMACELVIRPLKQNGYSLMGIINFRMFYTDKEIRVGRLQPNIRYYIYAEYDSGMETDPSAFKVQYYLDEQPPSVTRLPLCTVTTSYPAVVDADVAKPYAKNIMAHTMDTTNPHGRRLAQEFLNVRSELTVGGAQVLGGVYRSYTTAGATEVPLKAPGGMRPVFVQAYPESVDAGAIAWRIDGDTAYMSNSGAQGVRVNVKMDVEADR